MSSPSSSRPRGTSSGYSGGRRPTQKQLREAASQLAEEGQLLWLVGQGLHFALTAAEAASPNEMFVDSVRVWASRAVGAAATLRREGKR
jgi:hypothetical protein